MKKILKLMPLAFTLLCATPLTACGGDDVSELVGVWWVDSAYEETIKYYWGDTDSLGTNNVPGIPTGSSIEIKANKKAIFTYPNAGDEIEGRVAYMFGKVRFHGFNFSSDYKFELGTNSDNRKILKHSWSENKHGLDYTEKSREIVLTLRP